MFGHVFEVKRGPRLIPVNESMVWIDYQPFLDTFFKDLGRDLSSDKNRESYAYSNFSIIEFVMIGSKSSDYGRLVGRLFCFDLGFHTSNPVIKYRPDASCMSYMEPRAEMP